MVDVNSHWTQYCLYHVSTKLGFTASMQVDVRREVGQGPNLRVQTLHVVSLPWLN